MALESVKKILLRDFSDIPEMKLHPVTMSFLGEFAHLEKPFRADYAAASLGQAQLAGFLALFVFAAFGIVDAYWAPEHKEILWAIRYGLVCPVILGMTLVSYSRLFQLRFLQGFIMALILLGGFSIMVMMVIIAPKIYSLGLTLVLVLNYTSVKARFFWASLSGLVLLIAFNVVSLFFMETEPSLIYVSDFFGASLILVGMFACYLMEYYSRRNYLLSMLLNNERQKVKHVNEKLEDRIEERTAQLARANEDLTAHIEHRKQAENRRIKLEQELRHAQKMEAIGTLAGGIAHDFNNLLTGIMAFSEITLQKMDAPAEMRENIQQILRASHRGRDLVQQILTATSKREEEKSPIRLDLIIRESLGLLEVSLPAMIEIQANLGKNLPMVMADASQVQQVLLNLCTNAAHSMEKTGGTMEVSLERCSLEAGDALENQGLAPGNFVLLKVSDSGPGMEPETLEHIFDPYFTTKEKGQGTGLGLYVVHGIMQNHGGAILAESKQGEGAVFRAYFPVYTIESGRRPSRPAPQREEGGDQRILLVDDEEVVLLAAKKVLENMGYTVTARGDSQMALDAFLASPHDFDLVITDQVMPRLTGAQLVKKMLAVRPDLPALLITGYSESLSKSKARDLGAKGVLFKPFTWSELCRAVKDALDLEEKVS